MRGRAAAYVIVIPMVVVAVLGGSGNINAAEILQTSGLGVGNTIIRLPGIEGGISQAPSAVGVRSPDGRTRRITLSGGKLAVSEAALPSKAAVPGPADMLVDSDVTHGRADIARAWLTDPTERLSDVSAYGTNQRDYLREDFCLICVPFGHYDETEIADTSDRWGQGDQGHPLGNTQAILGRRKDPHCP